MKFVDEFRDPEMAKAILERIHTLVEEIPQAQERPLQIMEVCGGHTHSIFRYGLEELLPKKIEMVHGPGCPQHEAYRSMTVAARPDRSGRSHEHAHRGPP